MWLELFVEGKIKSYFSCSEKSIFSLPEYFSGMQFAIL